MTPPYKPLPPARLYLGESEWKERLGAPALARLTPFAVPDAKDAIDVGARAGHNFAAERAAPNANVFEAVSAACARRCKARANAWRSRCGARVRASA